MYQANFFDDKKRLMKVSKLGDPLERLNEVIDWDVFRPILKDALEKKHKGPGGRPAYDCIVLFKLLVIGRIYNISDDQLEYQTNDRVSFKRFIGLDTNADVPDAKTIWHFRNSLAEAAVMKKLFEVFDQKLEDERIITHKGTIIDATFVKVPIQRNTPDENQQIKNGNIPPEWQEDVNKPKLRQKDTDARWTEKGGKSYFGYKDHVKVDSESKMVENYTVTSASVHDSLEVPNLIKGNEQVLYADSAYAGKPVASALGENTRSEIHEKGNRKHPLTDEQKARNNVKSRTRVRVEHVFGYMTNSLHGKSIRTIGLTRATFMIGLLNLVYNICRYEIITRLKLVKGIAVSKI